uniref:Uncharacterized protein n=1 Tax=mine drainage metagenome TaxID=410659 RepID=E6PP48_9ZZZZ
MTTLIATEAQRHQLEQAQRVLAMARLGQLPTPTQARQTLAAITAQQQVMRQRGDSALDLEPARVAASLLVLGHRVHAAMGIDAVRALGRCLAQMADECEEDRT